jgi:hypothetical protein
MAGPLLHLVGSEGGGLHLFGASSIGKTTLLRLAASVWGRGDTPGYVRSWRATANGLEGAAAGATDTALILDEVGQVEARDMAGALYSLANGAGKARAARDGGLREPRSWRVLTISSGEVPVDAKLIEDRGRKPRAGQLVRMLDIPATRAFGVFDRPVPEGDAAAFAKRCKLAATSAYGTAGPAFVHSIIAENVAGGDVRSMVADFVAAEVPPGADGQIDRAAQHLGLIMAAGELASAFGLTGWRSGEARDAAAWALKEWIKARGGTEAAEVRQAIKQVRLMIEAHGESRFQSLDDLDTKPVPNRLGWCKGAGREREWWVPPESWRAECCAGLDPQFVARVLAEHRMLRRQGGNTLQCTVNLGGDHRARAYVLTSAILDGAAMRAELLAELCAVARGDHAAKLPVTPATAVTLQSGYRSKAPELQSLHRLQVDARNVESVNTVPVTIPVSSSPEPDEAAIEERAALAAGLVPAGYLNAWARLNCEKPSSVSETDWLRALDDGGRLLDSWGYVAHAFGWTPDEIFDLTVGLIWHLNGERLEAFNTDRVHLSDGRMILRTKARGFA